tara:strand:- start:1006 stop:2316 length:1311 start_codon:yes stop_codon:yes gene_type:complete
LVDQGGPNSGKTVLALAIVSIIVSSASLSLFFQVSDTTAEYLDEIDIKLKGLRDEISASTARDSEKMANLDTEHELQRISMQTQLQSIADAVKTIDDDVTLMQGRLQEVKETTDGFLAKEERILAASAENNLIIYGSLDSTELLSTIWPRFQAQFPWAQVSYTEGFGPLVDRFVEEAKSGEPTADLIIVEFSLYHAAQNAGLVATFLDNRSVKFLPEQFRQSDGSWFGVTAVPLVVIYNKQLVGSEDIPKNWLDLGKTIWADSIIIPSISTVESQIAELEPTLGKKIWAEWLGQLATNNIRIVDSSAEAYHEVAEGRAKIAIVLLDPLLRYREEPDVGIAWVTPAPISLIVSAINSNAVHPNLARIFQEWITSPEGQLAVAATGRTPLLLQLDAPTILQQTVPKDIDVIFNRNPDAYVDPGKWLLIIEDLLDPVKP